MPRIKLNLVGETYGRLTVIEEAETHIRPSGQKTRRYKCQCECNNKCIVSLSNLRQSRQVSCGCHRKEAIKKALTKHGCTKTKEYLAWQGIKKRCNNPNSISYKNYGARGITIDAKWIDDFEQFLSDVGHAPEGDNVSIDRINTNGNYEPSNVRWVVNQSVQCINQRIQSNNTSGHKGVFWHKAAKKWVAVIYIDKKKIHLGYFNTKKEAIAARQAAEEQYHKPLLEKQ